MCLYSCPSLEVLIKIPSDFPANTVVWYAPAQDISVDLDESYSNWGGRYYVHAPIQSGDATFCIRSQALIGDHNFSLKIRDESEQTATIYAETETVTYHKMMDYDLYAGFYADSNWGCRDFSSSPYDGLAIEVNYNDYPGESFDYCATTTGDCPVSRLTVSGRVTLSDGVTGIPFIDVTTDTGGSDTTDSNGYYLIDYLGLGTHTV